MPEAIRSRSQLVAVDSNVLFDLVNEVDDIVDGLSLIQERIEAVRFLMPPTVQHELAAWMLSVNVEKQKFARAALKVAQSWHILPASLIAVRHGIAERIAQRLRQKLIPEEEVNDSLVLAESALLECRMLLTSDEHLRSIDYQELTLELQSFDLGSPIIATPREVVRKFFRH